MLETWRETIGLHMGWSLVVVLTTEIFNLPLNIFCKGCECSGHWAPTICAPLFYFFYYLCKGLRGGGGPDATGKGDL